MGAPASRPSVGRHTELGPGGGGLWSEGAKGRSRDFVVWALQR